MKTPNEIWQDLYNTEHGKSTTNLVDATAKKYAKQWLSKCCKEKIISKSVANQLKKTNRRTMTTRYTLTPL